MTLGFNMVWVHFNKPTKGKQDWFFTSLQAIYGVFTAEEIGCNIKWLWQQHIGSGNTYISDKCSISKHVAIRKIIND